jgi:4a-hydroxytetrahydrobiopterin dehydratase
MSSCNLNDKSCKPCEGGTSPLNDGEITKMLTDVNQWQVSEDKKSIYKDFKFKGFYKTMAFVNAIAWIANKEGHHPDLKVGYNYCHVLFTTHAIDGLSENDFICAAKIDML